MMLRIRRVEERLSQLFADGEVPGFIHLSIGQEAIAAGVGSVLERHDTVASTHRGHGHALAKGMALDGFFMEILGRDTGICRGRGGSMHVADMSVGMLGANGIVGAGIPLATGSALAHQVRRTGGVAVAFFGDGALAEGVLHESLNLAALWKLPVLFVCENNGWSEFSPTARQFTANVRELAAAFGIEGELVDGNDAAEVAATAGRLVGEARDGGGPRVLECITRRVRGHFEGDPQKYRDDAEGDPEADPLARSLARLKKARVKQKDIDTLTAEVEAEIEAAVEAARAAPSGDFAAALADVYTGGGG
ncbi:MAG TPA: thiamine pyrophosphate-dependent dehydrogenase E1 component subunit alpha [Paracoccaceae bacterium]|nr:thiamine pyrophosphate-dependent dehydrogenase E1 component subunit alpha [Paracoccaceae bacterium]